MVLTLDEVSTSMTKSCCRLIRPYFQGQNSDVFDLDSSHREAHPIAYPIAYTVSILYIGYIYIYIIGNPNISHPSTYPSVFCIYLTRSAKPSHCRGLKGRGRLSELEARGLFAQMAEALRHSHALEVVHRDFKPHNILWPGPSWVNIFYDDGSFSVQEFGQQIIC